MRGFIGLTSKEKEDIVKQHNNVYDGYAVGNVNSNLQPLTYTDVKDSAGLTVSNKNNVTNYKNHRINEITAKPLNYDEIWPAYDYDSPGPQQSMVQPNPGKKPYEFDSKGPVDVYEDDFMDFEDENISYYGDEDMGIEDDEENVFDTEGMFLGRKKLSGDMMNMDDETGLNESIEKTLDLFKRFQKYN